MTTWMGHHVQITGSGQPTHCSQSRRSRFDSSERVALATMPEPA